MDSVAVADLTRRIGRMEKRHAIWRASSVGALFVAALTLTLEVARLRGRPAVVAAREFVVVNAIGRPVIRLGVHADAASAPALQFLDGNGAAQIVVGVNNNVPGIFLLDPDTGDQLVLSAMPRRGPSIAFRDGGNRSGLLIATDKSGVMGIGLMDKGGNPVMQLGMRPDGSVSFALLSKDGKKLFEIPAAQSGGKRESRP